MAAPTSSPQIGDEPFFKLVHELRGNAVVWSEAHFAHAYPATPLLERTDSLMVERCRADLQKMTASGH
jgi:hypothetical protein